MRAFQLEMREMHKTADFRSNLLVSRELVTEGYRGRPMKCTFQVKGAHFIERLLTRYGISRFAMMKPEELVDQVSRTFIMSYPKCRAFLDEALHYHLLPHRYSNIAFVFVCLLFILYVLTIQ